jgi:four helix bundle protein
MKENVIKIKSFAFALNIVKLYQYLTDSKKEYILSKQMLRSGTAIGAMVREAEHAESKADFIHKLSIGLKEANETEYWLELLYQSDYIDKNDFESYKTEVEEILRMLISIIKSSKKIGN